MSLPGSYVLKGGDRLQCQEGLLQFWDLHKLPEVKLESVFLQFFRSVSLEEQLLLDAKCYCLLSFSHLGLQKIMVPLNALISSLQHGWILPKSLLGTIR